MKALLNIETDTADKLALLIRVAEEMGMGVEQAYPNDPFTLASQSSLTEAWDSPEDSHWDEAFAHLKK